MEFCEVTVELNKEMPCVSEVQALRTIGIAAGDTHSSKNNDLEYCRRRALQCIASGHHSVLEHVNVSIVMLVDRGTSHALVRHRHVAVTQESTLYTKYKDGITFVKLYEEDPITHKSYALPERLKYVWQDSLKASEESYNKLIAEGIPTTIARDVLPNDTATKITLTTNLREWFWIATLRASPADSIRMHVVADKLNKLFEDMYPEIYTGYKMWCKAGAQTK
jgi:thymidylate synthase (FAD)